jgi:hypothetical protein
MTSTPQCLDYSIPPSPLFPPVPCVSRASVSSLNSLYESDGERSSPYTKYEINDDVPRTPEQTYYSMSKYSGQYFTEDDLAKAFQDRTDLSPPSSNANRLVHDASDPQSPWKRSIRLRYSDVNMRDSNARALQEASDLVSQDMSNYVYHKSNSKTDHRWTVRMNQYSEVHLFRKIQLLSRHWGWKRLWSRWRSMGRLIVTVRGSEPSILKVIRGLYYSTTLWLFV